MSTPDSHLELQYPLTPHPPTLQARSLTPARNIADGSILALRRAVLGDHLFVRPLEDVGIGQSRAQAVDGDDGSMDHDDDFAPVREVQTPLSSPSVPLPRSISPPSTSVPALNLSMLPDFMRVNMESQSPDSDTYPKSLMTPDTTPISSSRSSSWVGQGGPPVVTTTMTKRDLIHSGSDSGRIPSERGHKPEMEEFEEGPLTPLSELELQLGLGQNDGQHLDVNAKPTSNAEPGSESERKRPLPRVRLVWGLGNLNPSDSRDGDSRNLDDVRASLGTDTTASAHASTSADASMSSMKPQRKGKKRKSLASTSRELQKKKIKREIQTEAGETEAAVTLPRPLPLAQPSNRSCGRPRKSNTSGSKGSTAKNDDKSHRRKSLLSSCDPDLLFDWPAKLPGDDQSVSPSLLCAFHQSIGCGKKGILPC